MTQRDKEFEHIKEILKDREDRFRCSIICLTVISEVDSKVHGLKEPPNYLAKRMEKKPKTYKSYSKLLRDNQ